jgi:hypothetical protein
VPHRYCQNHYLRDVAAPVLAADRHAKVTLRKRVRGLRALERDALARRASVADPSASTSTSAEDADAVVLDYCAAARGILNDDQGGPLQPPGLRMAGALREVRASLTRCEAAQKGAPQLGRWRAYEAVSTAASPRSHTPSAR